MQTPSAADPSFKAFLDKLQEQNSRGFATQLVQLKADRENVGKDNDKREEQLDETNENLVNLKDETATSGSSIREGLYDVSDDIVEAQDQLDTINNTLSEMATAIIGTRESIEVEMLTALSDIKEAVTGIKSDIKLSELKTAIENIGSDVGKDIDSGHLVATTGAIGANTTKLLDEQLKELSLVRKLNEGSVEYDKEAAQYRNTSGRDIESKVSGKTSKSGGFLDFETARDTLSGQGDRVRKENKISLITGVTTTRPGKATSEALGGTSKSTEPVVEETFIPKNLSVEPTPTSEPLATVTKRARRERSSTTGTTGTAETRSEESSVPDTRGFFATLTDELKAAPGRVRDYLIDHEEKPDVKKKEREAKVSSERQAPVSVDNPEADNIRDSQEIIADNSKSDLELSKQMLDTTREQLVELKAIREALAPSTPKELTEQKSAPSSTNEKEGEGGGSIIGDLAGAAGNLLGGGRGRTAGKVAGVGSKILGGLGKAARVLGPAAAIAGAAYSGFSGYQNTGANFDLKEGEEATVGQKTASTLGGVASGLTFGLLDEKTATQGIHKAGSYIGEKASSIGSSISNFFGVGSKDTSKSVPTQSVSNTTSTVNNNSKVSTVNSAPSTVQGVSTEAAAAARSNYAAVDPRRVDTSTAAGATVAQTSTENADMSREANKGGNNNTVVSNNVSNNETTKFMPSKPSPRPEFTGSALDRYLNKTAVY